METNNDLAKRILTLKRTFDAPVKLAWEAWTQSGHIANWWAPPGMEVDVIEHDFKVGGHWKYVMPMPNGSEFISEGVYSEIVEFERIVTSADFIPMTAGVELRIIFEAKGDQTEFTFGVLHPTEEYCRQQEQMGFYNGWGSAFERLNGYLQSL